MEANQDWPDYYTFKFVVTAANIDEVLSHLSNFKVSKKESSKGKYTSLTARGLFQSPDEVVEVYQKVCTIEGVISI